MTGCWLSNVPFHCVEEDRDSVRGSWKIHVKWLRQGPGIFQMVVDSWLLHYRDDFHKQGTLFNEIRPTSVSRYGLALDMYLLRKIFASLVEPLRSEMELSLMRECVRVFCGISNIFLFKSECGEWAWGGSFLVYCSLSDGCEQGRPGLLSDLDHDLNLF